MPRTPLPPLLSRPKRRPLPRSGSASESHLHSPTIPNRQAWDSPPEGCQKGRVDCRGRRHCQQVANHPSRRRLAAANRAARGPESLSANITAFPSRRPSKLSADRSPALFATTTRDEVELDVFVAGHGGVFYSVSVPLALQILPLQPVS